MYIYTHKYLHIYLQNISVILYMCFYLSVYVYALNLWKQYVQVHIHTQ